jgi:hypothetical protein
MNLTVATPGMPETFSSAVSEQQALVWYTLRRSPQVMDPREKLERETSIASPAAASF